MYALDPGDPPSHTLTWKPLCHIKRRTNDDRFPVSLWEFWLGSTLGVPIPDLIGTSHQCVCNEFTYDSFGDHLETCQVKSTSTQVHDWVVYRLGDILGSVGHRVKIHKITSATGKERGDLEIKDYGIPYVVLQKPQEQTDRLPLLVLLYWTLLWLTRVSEDHTYILSDSWHTQGVRMEIYDDFNRLLFLHTHREPSALSNELPEESTQFRFLRASCLVNIKGSVGWFWRKMWTCGFLYRLIYHLGPLYLHLASFVLVVLLHL